MLWTPEVCVIAKAKTWTFRVLRFCANNIFHIRIRILESKLRSYFIIKVFNSCVCFTVKMVNVVAYFIIKMFTLRGNCTVKMFDFFKIFDEQNV